MPRIVDDITITNVVSAGLIETDGTGLLQQRVTGIDLTTEVTGTLPVGNGGTGSRRLCDGA